MAADLTARARGGWGQLLLALVAGVVGIAGYRWWRGPEVTPAMIERQVEGTFNDRLAAMRTIEVMRYTASARVVTNDTRLGGMLQSQQRTDVPFSVVYTVDLARLGRDAVDYDPVGRTLRVDVPEITVGEPNVDEAHASVEQSGIFITRAAGQALAIGASMRAAQLAATTARAPARLQAARANARVAVAQLLHAPLAAAGLGAVRVSVRFPDEARRGSERWDESRNVIAR